VTRFRRLLSRRRALSLLLAGMAGALAGGRRRVRVGLGQGDGREREVLLTARLAEVPEPASLRLGRLPIGAGEAVATEVAGTDLVVVEAGEVAVSTDAAGLRLPAIAGAAATPRAAAGTEFQLSAGDRAAFEAGTALTLRAEGDGAASLLIVSIAEATDAKATPVAGGPRGLVTPLAAATVEQPPAGSALVTLERFRLQPGSTLPAYAGPMLLAVEEGSLATTLEAGRVLLSQGGAPAAAAAPAADATVTVEPGDALYFPAGLAESPPLAGDEPLVLLRLGLLPPPEDGEAGGAGQPPVGSEVVVALPGVRLRAEPSAAGEVLAELAQGELLIVAGEAVAADGRAWLPVQLAADPALAGFVAAELVEPVAP